jgi:glutathione S-transferase
MKIAGTSLRPIEIWRDDTSLAEARVFGASLIASFVRGARGARVGRLGPRPEQILTLYSIETCPYSRLVREALSELDIDVLIKPCPKREPIHRAELEDASGRHKVPYLIDPNQQVSLGESAAIVAYLFGHYGAGGVPAPLSGGPVSLGTSKVASEVRGGIMYYEAPALMPARPLELFGYEASPYCRLVREQLDRLGIAYISRNLARESPRRPQFEKDYGKLQFPYLWDPNTGVGMFETGDILTYVAESYKRGNGRSAATASSKKTATSGAQRSVATQRRLP